MAWLYVFLLSSCIFAESLQYDLGQSYGYDYTSVTTLDDVQHGGTSVHQISAHCDVTTVWKNPSNPKNNLLMLTLKDIKFGTNQKKSDDIEYKQSGFDSLHHSAILVDIEDGRVLNLYAQESEPATTLNIKRSIASLLQHQLENGHRTEDDVSGTCNVQYTRDGRIINKVKTNCVTKHQPKVNINQVLGVSVRSDRHAKLELDEDQSRVERIQTVELHTMSLNVQSSVGTKIQNKLELQRSSVSEGSQYVVQASSKKDAIEELEKALSYKLEQQRLSAEPESAPCFGDCDSLEKIVEQLRKESEKSRDVTVSKSGLIVRLIRKLSHATEDEIKSLLKDKDNKRIKTLLTEAVAASNNPAAISAVISKLDFKTKSHKITPQERFLLALAVASHPSPETITTLKKILTKDVQNVKLQDSLLLTLATLTNKLSTVDPTHKVVKDVREFLLSRLSKCSDESCKLTSLRSLGSLASPETIEVLLTYFQQTPALVTEAVLALQKIPPQHITEKVVEELEAIYHQIGKPQRSTVRTLAAEILLASNPQHDVLNRILRSLGNPESAEIDTFVLMKLKQLMATDTKIRSQVASLLKDPSIGNYNSLIPGGLSTSFTRLFTESEDGNSTYGFSLEVGAGGIMKRSEFDVRISTKKQSLSLFKFGIFAGGLAGLAGVESDEPEDEEATGGIKLGILGVDNRPYVFFTGQGELMGLMFAGTGSTLTNIIRGNYILQDHQQLVPLQNGFVAKLDVLGVLSFDLSGQVEISLWSKNAQTLIRNKVSVVTRGSAVIECPAFTAKSQFTLSSNGKLEFQTNSDFSDTPLKMCTKMSQPPLSVSYDRTMSLKIHGHKLSQQHKRRSTNTHEGRTYFLHPKISQMCTAMENYS